MRTKACSRCGEVKPLADFHIMRASKKDGRRPDCKPCHSEATKVNRAKHFADDPEKYRAAKTATMRKMRYGITEDEYDALLAQQGGGCYICGATDGRRKVRQGDVNRQLCVDHDHVTGGIRGLLCDPCNVGLSRFDDDPERLRKAAQYLERVMTYQN